VGIKNPPITECNGLKLLTPHIQFSIFLSQELMGIDLPPKKIA
jgi:hypothetical protein